MVDKKAQIQQLQPIVVAMVAVGIVLVVGFLIFAEMKDQVIDLQSGDWCVSPALYNETSNQCCNATTNCIGENASVATVSASFNATNTVMDATSDIPGWLSIIIIVVVGGLLVALVAFIRNR